MDRLEQIKQKIERAKTYGTDPSVTLADIEWLIGQAQISNRRPGEFTEEKLVQLARSLLK